MPPLLVKRREWYQKNGATFEGLRRIHQRRRVEETSVPEMPGKEQLEPAAIMQTTLLRRKTTILIYE